MFRLLKYIAIVLVVIGCFFWLDRQGSFSKFIEEIVTAPKLDPRSIFKDLNTKNSLDNLATTTSTSTRKKPVNEVKSDTTNKDALSIAGIIKYTNIERVKIGLKPLTFQKQLGHSATLKADDMFARQYFEHVSPQGISASDLVKDAGYNFELIGENLALGNFGTDQKLVTAWMNSPKHKANILNPKFTEIGVSASKGTYKGDTQWIFVQHFGRPVPNCPKADATLKEKIDSERIVLGREDALLKQLASDIEADPQKVDSSQLELYNSRVATYNNRLTAWKESATLYNAQVTQYNACLSASR